MKITNKLRSQLLEWRAKICLKIDAIDLLLGPDEEAVTDDGTAKEWADFAAAEAGKGEMPHPDSPEDRMRQLMLMLDDRAESIEKAYVLAASRESTDELEAYLARVLTDMKINVKTLREKYYGRWPVIDPTKMNPLGWEGPQ